jgi:hypothetical protein
MTKCDRQFELSSLHAPPIPPSGGNLNLCRGRDPYYLQLTHLQVLMSGEPVKSFKIVPASLPYTCPSTPTTRGKAIEEAQRYSVWPSELPTPRPVGGSKSMFELERSFPQMAFCTGMGATLMKAPSSAMRDMSEYFMTECLSMRLPRTAPASSSESAAF